MNASGSGREGVGGGSGDRRLQREEIPFRRASRSFAGIGPSVSPGRMVAAAKAASPAMAWPRGLIDVLDRLVAFSRLEDWRPGRRPIVWPSNRVLAEVWGVGRTQVKSRIRQLARAGLMVMAESPNGQRWGRRDDKGRIVEAYGFDLSPLASRYREFADAARRLKADRLRRSQARRRITIGLRHLAQLRQLAIDAGGLSREDHDAFETWSARATAEAGGGRAASSAEEAIAAALRIESIVETAEAAVGDRLALPGALAGANGEAARSAAPATAPATATMIKEESGPMGPAGRPPITTTTELLDPPIVQRCQGPSSGAGGARSPERETGETPKPTEGRRYRSSSGFGPPADRPAPRRPPGDSTTVAEILRLAPALAQHLAGGETVTWASVVEAADRLRAAMGVSRAAWIEACARLGREGAALLVGIIAAKRHWLKADDPGYPRVAGAYFRGMLDRHASGQLHLGRTLWGMRAARLERLQGVAAGDAP